jgi:YHS domain-containing protein
MIRFFVIRILLPLAVFLILRALVKTIWAASKSPVSTKAGAPGSPIGGELKKDPVCGTFVALDASVTRKVNGELIHFCSTACRDKYVA